MIFCGKITNNNVRVYRSIIIFIVLQVLPRFAIERHPLAQV